MPELLEIGDPLLPVVRSRVWRVGHDAREWFERSAERWAICEHLRRLHDGLFFQPPWLGDPDRWPAVNDQWDGKSVAVFSEGRHDDHRPYVGVCFGVRPEFLGPALVVAHFGHFGITSNISPLGVYDIFELPPEFSEPPGRYDEDDE